MNKFTKGDFTLDKYGTIRCSNQAREEKTLSLNGVALAMYDSTEVDANTKLTFKAFVAATKLAEAGYDAVKVIELLPQIMQHIEQCATDSAHGLFVQCRGE